MSTSSEYSEFSGNKPARSPEKSTFSQKCSLLSQYIKEKGSFGDLTLGMTCKPEPCGSSETSCQSATTMNLFPTKENNVTPNNLTAMDLLSPQTFRPAEEIPTLVNSSAIKCMGKGAKSAQMTIFYGGQVVVFDDFPADKASEIMSYASKGVPQSQNNSVYTYTQSQPSFPPTLVRTCADSSAPIIPSVNIAATNNIHEHPQAPSRPVVCELPIARKASLHRFLEKRKDRIASKAPYQVTNGDANKPGESMPWLGLGATSPQI
ncbi:protein TIFY 10B [Cajanus cajan]|uniref:Protein TIFY n=1 Tax=Cajanus cajan TaxID=3821 RepID=A0A151R9Z7_CAJCA|nr:protein TIFY 10B [Cajanus cajan]KYP39464.1 Protein TIFY 10B [Cajanus cajan]